MQEISLHLLDIAQNSVCAGASLIEITVHIDPAADRLAVAVVDNGRGMAEAEALQATDPFYTTRTTRRIGMGLPLLKMAAELTGGSFSLDTQPGEGCDVRAEFVLSHIDTMPLGDMAATICSLIAMNEQLDFVYRYSGDGSTPEPQLDTRELREVLQGIPLSAPEVLDFIRKQLITTELEGT